MVNNSTIAWKTRARLDDFMVKMFHGFPKPQNKFIRDMVHGIQATISPAEGVPDNYKGCRRCRDGTSFHISAQDSQ